MPLDLDVEDTGQLEEDKRLTRVGIVFQEKNQPHNLDLNVQKDESKKIKVEILKINNNNCSESYTPGTQKLKCKVLQVPSIAPSHEDQQTPVVGDVIFIKVFDAMFFPRVISAIDMHFKVTARADMALSNEVGAYAFLYKQGLTGAPHIAPQWLGCWTAEVQSSSPEYQCRTRHVGVVALEFIDGICLQKLWVRNELDKQVYVGDIPRVDDDTETLLQVDEATRLGTMKDLLADIVKQYKVGVTHYHIRPENVIVSFRRGSQELARPRVSLVGYKDSVVGPLREPPRNKFARYPNPTHPYWRFNYERLESFFDCHWLPVHWKTGDSASCPRLDKWMLETFGPFDGDKYSSYIFKPSVPNVTQPIDNSTVEETSSSGIA